MFCVAFTACRPTARAGWVECVQYTVRDIESHVHTPERTIVRRSLQYDNVEVLSTRCTEKKRKRREKIEAPNLSKRKRDFEQKGIVLHAGICQMWEDICS